MMTMLDKPILEFVENEVDFQRLEMIHGTLYVKLTNDTDCGILHEKLEKFYRETINPAGAVNMYFVGDDFAFDFVDEESKDDEYDTPCGYWQGMVMDSSERNPGCDKDYFKDNTEQGQEI